MLKTRSLKTKKLSFDSTFANVAIMAIFLFLGLAVGVIFAINGDISSSADFICNDLFKIAQNGTDVYYSFSKTFVNLSKYPFLVFLSAFCAFGFISIPIIALSKGFMISLSVSSFIAILGKRGVLAALSLFGIQTLAEIPVLLIISAISFENSKKFTSVILPQKYQIQAKRIKIGAFTMFSVGCFLFLILISLIDSIITPRILSLISKTLLIQ